MLEENKTQTTEVNEQPVETMETNYLEQIQNLKKSTVSKSEYEKVLDENKKLLDAVINGQPAEQPSAPKPKVDKDKLRQELYGQNADSLSNLEYITKTLELRQAIIDEGGNDPFLPFGEKISPTDEDYAAAQRVGKILQECVEYAQGDSEVFTNELQRRTKETSIKRR